MPKNQKPMVGVGVMLLKGNKVLLGRRHEDPKMAKSELHGEGTWTMPGGKVEFGEKLRAAAVREVFEETGILLEKADLEIISVADDIGYGAHFVTIGFLCRDFEGEAKVMEPDEITKWGWFSLNKIPERIFGPSQEILEAFMKKRDKTELV
ncbi:MAG: nucleotide triphosphate diphosphatase NUDT15 [Candidatus Aenigmatarchaeota archaeon]